MHSFYRDLRWHKYGILYLAATDATNEGGSGSISYLYALNESDGSAIWGIQFSTQIKTFAPMPPKGSSATPRQTLVLLLLDLGVIEPPTIGERRHLRGAALRCCLRL